MALKTNAGCSCFILHSYMFILLLFKDQINSQSQALKVFVQQASGELFVFKDLFG